MFIVWPGCVVKEKDVSAAEDIQSHEEMEGTKKRHLNVVFIGHVGMLVSIIIIIISIIFVSYYQFDIMADYMVLFHKLSKYTCISINIFLC